MEMVTTTIEHAPAAPAERAIDRGHLAHVTFGDRNLEREVLLLFDRQAALLIARMRTSNPSAVEALAHTLKGSAAGIGAWTVARAAAEAAQLASTEGATECDVAVQRLAAAVDEARTAIIELLRVS
jgi:HPt (histidine-containing phosphotransfer) domain-containing protein